VIPPFLLAQAARPTRAPLRLRQSSPRLRFSDPACDAMTDFLRDPPLTVSEDTGVDEAIDQMFRLGVRVFLVVRDSSVVGLMTASDATRHSHRQLRVAEVMTPTDEIPAISWETLAEARVADLVEIFDGTGVHHLAVMESHSATLTSVRGLVNRDRLARQLRSAYADTAMGSLRR
jgi:CBS domain-containing protein